MFLMFARFDFKSPDLAAEDQNYFDNHVRLARRLPGVRMYLTGKLIETRLKPDRYRAVLFGYDTAPAAMTSLDNPVGAELMADSAAHIVGTTVTACEGEEILPFSGRKPGHPCAVIVLLYNLLPGAAHRLRSYADSIRRLPDLCGYMAGRTFEARGEKPDRERMEIRIAAPEVLRTPSWDRLIAPDDSLMTAALIHAFEGEVQI